MTVQRSEFGKRVTDAIGRAQGIVIIAIRELMSQAWQEGYARGLRPDQDPAYNTNPYVVHRVKGTMTYCGLAKKADVRYLVTDIGSQVTCYDCKRGRKHV